MVTEETEQPKQIIANTVVAKNDDGKLEVFVHGQRVVGTVNVQITNEGALILAIMPHAFRLVARDGSKWPVYETKDNVIAFPLMEAKRREWAEQSAAEAPAREAVEDEQELVAVPHGDDDDAPEH